jgi:hypothetical protein
VTPVPIVATCEWPKNGKQIKNKIKNFNPENLIFCLSEIIWFSLFVFLSPKNTKTKSPTKWQLAS